MTQSCKIDDSVEEIRPGHIYYIQVIDQNGNDLLDLNNPNRIDDTKIMIYDEINGEKVLSSDYLTGATLIIRYVDEKTKKQINALKLVNIHSTWKIESQSLINYIEWTPDNVDKIEFPYRSAEFKINGVAATETLDQCRSATIVIQR